MNTLLVLPLTCSVIIFTVFVLIGPWFELLWLLSLREWLALILMLCLVGLHRIKTLLILDCPSDICWLFAGWLLELLFKLLLCVRLIECKLNGAVCLNEHQCFWARRRRLPIAPYEMVRNVIGKTNVSTNEDATYICMSRSVPIQCLQSLYVTLWYVNFSIRVFWTLSEASISPRTHPIHNTRLQCDLSQVFADDNGCNVAKYLGIIRLVFRIVNKRLACLLTGLLPARTGKYRTRWLRSMSLGCKFNSKLTSEKYNRKEQMQLCLHTLILFFH